MSQNQKLPISAVQSGAKVYTFTCFCGIGMRVILNRFKFRKCLNYKKKCQYLWKVDDNDNIIWSDTKK